MGLPRHVMLCQVHYGYTDSDETTVVSHIYTYDRAQNILNFVQQLQKLIL